jgi:hypothetical protein
MRSTVCDLHEMLHVSHRINDTCSRREADVGSVGTMGERSAPVALQIRSVTVL